MTNQEVVETLASKEITTEKLIVTGTETHTRTGQVISTAAMMSNAGATATVGYVKAGRDTCMLTLAQNATADTQVVNLPGLKDGDIITAIGITGQIESGGNAVTVDYQLRAMTAVATGSTDAAIQVGTQVAKTADYLMNETTALATPHTIVSGEHPYFLLTCTTGATTDIEILHVSVTITQK